MASIPDEAIQDRWLRTSEEGVVEALEGRVGLTHVREGQRLVRPGLREESQDK